MSDALPEKISDPWIIVDRVEIDNTDATQIDRLSQSISTAFEHGEDVVGIYHFNKKKKLKNKIIIAYFDVEGSFF